MKAETYDSFLKTKNLWPSKRLENWKYFDFSKFQKLTSDVEFSNSKFKIIYSTDSGSEAMLVLSEETILVSSDLKNRIKVSLINQEQFLNQDSNLDFSMTSYNLKGQTLKIVVENEKDLNLKVVYLGSKAKLNLALSVRFEFVNSSVDLVEELHPDTSGHLSVHSQIKLNNSRLGHVIISSNANKINSAQILNSEVALFKDSEYKNTSLLLRNAFLRAQQSVSLNDPNTSGHLACFNISDEKTFSELRTEVLHLAPKSESRQLFKTIASDEAKTVFNGRIYVDSEAQKTDAAQLCQGIVLNPKAEIDAKPELEIYADDVKASHGAAIGQLSHDQIFYLVSRGIKPEEAYKILSQGFAGEVLATIGSLEIRKMCTDIVTQSAELVFQKLAESFK